MVVTDRISAFDVLLPVGDSLQGTGTEPDCGRIFLEQTGDIVPNWFIVSPDPNVVIGHLCKPYRIEMVIRDTWRDTPGGSMKPARSTLWRRATRRVEGERQVPGAGHHTGDAR